MASVQNKLVLSSVFVLVAALVACGKPEIRSKTMDAPSPSSNPKTAEAENKAGDAAAQLAAGDASKKADPNAAKDAAAKLDKQREARQAALTELTDIMKREGVDQAEVAKARLKLDAATANLPPDEAAAAAAADRDAAAKKAPLTADAAKEVIEQAARRAFAIAMVEPVMRANFQVFMTRHEVLRLRAKIESEKKALTKEETAWLQKARLEYGGVEEKAGFDALLERVDGVNLSFLAAPLALRSNYAVDSEVAVDKIIKRVQELNISPSDEKLRFRSARLAVKQGAQEESLNIMKAFLAYQPDDKNPVSEKILATVSELLQVMSGPAYGAEIERVRTLLLEEYKAKTAAPVPTDAAKK